MLIGQYGIRVCNGRMSDCRLLLLASLIRLGSASSQPLYSEGDLQCLIERDSISQHVQRIGNPSRIVRAEDSTSVEKYKRMCPFGFLLASSPSTQTTPRLGSAALVPALTMTPILSLVVALGLPVASLAAAVTKPFNLPPRAAGGVGIVGGTTASLGGVPLHCQPLAQWLALLRWRSSECEHRSDSCSLLCEYGCFFCQSPRGNPGTLTFSFPSFGIFMPERE